MAAGVNYNNVWAALGVPIDVVKVHAKGGDTTAFTSGQRRLGVVYKIGSAAHDGSRSATRSSSIRGMESERSGGEGRPRSDVRAELPIWGLRKPTGAASRNSPRSRPTSAPEAEASHLEGAAAYMLVAPPPIAC